MVEIAKGSGWRRSILNLLNTEMHHVTVKLASVVGVPSKNQKRDHFTGKTGEYKFKI